MTTPWQKKKKTIRKKTFVQKTHHKRLNIEQNHPTKNCMG